MVVARGLTMGGCLALLLSSCGRVSYAPVGLDGGAPIDAVTPVVDAALDAAPDADPCEARTSYDELGTGTAEDPFLICNEAQLRSLSGVAGAASVRLTRDIALTSEPFQPIGGTLGFGGTLDGDGHTIRGLVVDAPSAAQGGLAAGATDATFRDLTIVDADVRGVSRVGILLGAGVRVTIEGVRVEGVVEGARQVGGLAGQLTSSTVSDVRVDATVTAHERHAGGAIGIQRAGPTERVVVACPW